MSVAYIPHWMAGTEGANDYSSACGLANVTKGPITANITLYHTDGNVAFSKDVVVQPRQFDYTLVCGKDIQGGSGSIHHGYGEITTDIFGLIASFRQFNLIGTPEVRFTAITINGGMPF